MRGRRTLTAEAAIAIKAMYAERDSFDRPRYSQMDIAKKFGVGETTVYRAIHNVSAYTRTPEPIPADVVDVLAAESGKDMLTWAKEKGLLSEESATEKMVRALKRAKGPADEMLGELKEDTNGSH